MRTVPTTVQALRRPQRSLQPRFDAHRGDSYTAAHSQRTLWKPFAMDAKEFIRKTVTEHPVVLFMKGTAQFPQCGFSGRAIQILKQCGVKNLVTVNVLEDEEVRQGVKDFANWPTIPQLYVNGEFVGGSDIMMEMFESGELKQVLDKAQAA